MPLPLLLRLPNPPALFVGRASQVRALESALLRGAVAVVQGEAGIGKSALVAATLHARFPDRVSRTVRVSLRDCDEPAALPVARALARLGAASLDLGAALADEAALAALALDLAEAADAWVFLDDAESAPAQQVEPLLRCFAAYARRARLVCATRAALADPDLVAQTVVVGPLSARDLEKLGRASGKDHLDEALARAGGNPLAFLRALAAPVQRRPLSRVGRAIADVLACTEGAVPEDVLLVVVDDGLPGIDELVGLGMVERDGGRLHALVPLPTPAEVDVERILATLAELDWPEGWLLSLRRQLVVAPHEALALCERRAGELLALGYPHALAALLAGRTEPALARLRLRCAVLLGDTRALSREPSLAASRDRELTLLHARLLLQDDRPSEALGRLTELARTDVEAALLAGQAALRLGDYEQARVRLEGARCEGPLAVRRDSLLASMYAVLRRPTEALRLVESVRAALPGVPGEERCALARSLAQAVYFLGHLDLARTLVDEALAHPAASIRTETGRLLQFVRMSLALEGGELAVARAELDRLAPWAAERSVQAPWIRLAHAHLELADGHLPAVQRRLDDLTSDPIMSERQTEVAYLRRLVDLERAAPFEEAEVEGDTIFARLHALAVVRHRVRATESAVTVSADTEHAELRVLHAITLAEQALAEGDAERSLRLSGDALRDARATGFGLHLAAALVLRGDAQALLAGWHALAETAHELAALGASAPSRALAAHARFFAEVAAPEPGGLESLAEGETRAARRAAAVLGDPAALDRIDARVVAVARARGLAPTRVTGSGERWGYAAGRVWDAAGQVIDLTGQPTPHRLLRALLSEQTATKEALVRAVWEERDYHPLRHDNRLQATVHKLRRLLGDDGEVPRRIRTTETGYTLVGRLRVHEDGGDPPARQ